MNSIITRILSELFGAARYKWHAMVFAWVICVLGWIGVSLLPNTYESKAVLYIDTASVLRPLLADLAVNTNVMSDVRMMSEVLLSRPQLERVVRDTDLHQRATSAADMEKLLANVKQRIQVSGGSPRNTFNEQNFYTIKFYDKDPETVYAVVQSLLDSFVERSLGQNKADSVEAQKFIQEQIAQYERRLAEAEQELAEFKRKNVGLMPSDGQDYYERMQSAVDELERLRGEQSKIETRRSELQRQIDGEEPTFGLLTPPDSREPASNTDNSAISLAEQELATLLLKYTDKHPKVIDLRNRIEQMRNQQAQQAARDGGQSTSPLGTDLTSMNTLDLNPVYQNMKIAISAANAELSEVREQIAASESRVQYLRSMVDKVPEIEAQLARLNRDYEVNKAQHTALLRRLESVRLTEEADSQTGDIKFQVIEPPVVPVEPVGPERNLFSTVVLFGGIGLGAVLALLLNLVSPVFNSVIDLRHHLQLPVLGSISAFHSPEQKRLMRRSTRRFIYAAAALVMIYSVAIVFGPATEVIRKALLGGGFV